MEETDREEKRNIKLRERRVRKENGNGVRKGKRGKGRGLIGEEGALKREKG
jgi:hypothetical protein